MLLMSRTRISYVDDMPPRPEECTSLAVRQAARGTWRGDTKATDDRIPNIGTEERRSHDHDLQRGPNQNGECPRHELRVSRYRPREGHPHRLSPPSDRSAAVQMIGIRLLSMG